MQFTIGEINKQFKNKLKNVYSNTEIQQMLFLIYERVLSLTKIKVLTNTNELITDDKCKIILNIKERLYDNEPIQYILGETEFFDLHFKVNKSVLVPRPETEELVQWVIESCENNNIKILDAGTGSGCIAISLAKNIVGARVYAVDISKDALDTAKNNSLLNNTSVIFTEYDILGNSYGELPKNIDVLVSNPPYIRDSEKILMKQNVLDYEPNIALFVSDNDPLIFYRKIAIMGKSQLVNGGTIFFEINEALGNEVMNMLKGMEYSKIEIRQDINGKDRMIKAVC